MLFEIFFTAVIFGIITSFAYLIIEESCPHTPTIRRLIFLLKLIAIVCGSICLIVGLIGLLTALWS